MKWIESDTKISGFGRDIIYAKEKYYIAFRQKNGIAISEDLRQWDNILLDNIKIGTTENLAYGNNTFILTGGAGELSDTYIYVSKNGLDWSLKKINTTQNFSMHSNSCKFLNNRFVFLTTWYNYNITTGIRNYTVIQIHETRNGNSIVRHDFKYNGNRNVDAMDIAYGLGLYVLVGESGSIFTSKDLITWTERNSGVTSKLVGISFGKSFFTITGANGVILTSSDGINWIRRKTSTDSYLIRSRYANGIFLAVGYNGTILSSVNAIDWVEENDPFTNGVYYGLTYANDKFVITSGFYSSGTIPIVYSEITRELSYSTDNSLYVFDKYLNFLGVIDEYISLRWRRKYYEAGEMELCVANYKNNLKLLRKGNIIIRQNYTEAAIINLREYDDDGTNVMLKVSGNFLSFLLKRRIIKSKIVYSGNYIDGMKEIIDKMTPLCSNFEIEPTYLDSESTDFQVTYKKVYDYLVNLSKNSNVGFRIVPNVETKVFRFENFKGLDRTRNQIKNERYCFSKENSNLSKENIIDSDVDKCNYALVGGVGEDDNRILKEVRLDDSIGFDLYETFVDARSENNSNMSYEKYLKILENKGKENLKDDPITISFTGNPKDYKEKWDLGDIVDVDLKEVIDVDSIRITEVEEVIQKNSKSIYPTFGPPLAEKISLE